MATIISLDVKFQETRDKRLMMERRQKLVAVRNALQQAIGVYRCEKCQESIDPAYIKERDELSRLRVPYMFCDHCSEEYVDYIDRLQGRGDSTCFWRNDAWLESWRLWIDYRGSVDRYLRSKEFRQLLDELK